MPVSLVIPLVVGAMAVGYGLGPGVRASFVSSSAKTTGLLSFAKLAGTFATGTNDTGGAGGTGGSTYVITVATLTLNNSTHRVTTLTNTGTVTSSFIGKVTGSGMTGTLNVAVDKCSVAWTSTTVCTGTTTALLAATALSTAPSVTYASAGSPLAANGVLNLRYTFTATSTTAAGTATAAATPTATGAGSDRTAG